MIEHKLSMTDLDDDLLLDLVRSSDPVGVLSITWTRESAATAGRATIEIKNRIAELERRMASNGSPWLADALSKGLERIAPLVEQLLDPRSGGRGRVLFVGLGGGEATRFSSRLRLPNRVVLDSTPFIHPLLELLDVGRPPVSS